MSTDPDQLRAEIDRTRANLSADVDQLTDRVAPANVARRQADKVKGAVGGAAASVKDRVMGTASDTHDRASAATSAVGDAATGAPARVRSQTRGNPMAAGLIALGAGWLLGSLLPASAREQQAASKVKEHPTRKATRSSRHTSRTSVTSATSSPCS